jgi:hypothetical protein
MFQLNFPYYVQYNTIIIKKRELFGDVGWKVAITCGWLCKWGVKEGACLRIYGQRFSLTIYNITKKIMINLSDIGPLYSLFSLL